MRRIAAAVLLLAATIVSSMPAIAQRENRSIGENQIEAKRASKKYQKYGKKQAKRQQKAMKKYQKAQKRAAKRQRHH